MYLAPLNYDKFFRKIFKEKKYAKAFLEDFLNINIETIEVLENKNYITDQSVPVEFDYICKLDSGKQIIIEMQQWYKTDVIKRFYLYHSLSSSVQLETMQVKSIGIHPKTKKVIKDKFYNDLKPVTTLIWMVDDELGFKEDFVAYKMTPEELVDFVKNEALWKSDYENILQERKRVINLEENKTKGLDFISQNKLVFMFQKNIVINNTKSVDVNNEMKLDEYVKWFDFALKTKNKKNKKEDFAKYKKDNLFIGIINKLLKNRLTDEEVKYITDEEEFKEAYKDQQAKVFALESEIKDLHEDKKKADEEKKKADEEKKKAQEEKKKAQEEKKKAQEEKKKAQEEKKEIIINMLKSNLANQVISQYTGVSISEIETIQNDINT